MNTIAFLGQLHEDPKLITFQDTIQVVEDNYDFTPTAFQNGTNTIGPERIMDPARFLLLQS